MDYGLKERDLRVDQFLCMAFAQPTFRESLRDIEEEARRRFWQRKKGQKPL
jgi:Domain of unknown function (DUF4372)